MGLKEKMEGERKDCMRHIDRIIKEIVDERRAGEIGDEFKSVFTCGFQAGFQRGYTMASKENKKEGE